MYHGENTMKKASPLPQAVKLGVGAVAVGLLRQGQAISFTAKGRSMAPFIRDGESLFVRPLQSSALPGHVVLVARPGGACLVHRVVRRTAQGVITRGDACRQEDGCFRNEDVLGRVVMVSGRRRLHLRHLFGRCCAAALGFRRRRALGDPLRPLARALCILAARL